MQVNSMLLQNEKTFISNQFAKVSPFTNQSEEFNKLNKVIPSALKKKDIQNMIPDKVDEAVELSEKLTIEWIHAYMEEVDRI